MPGIRVDGTDVLAVYEAVREAAERGRADGGPTFVECVHYRTAPHGTADDPRAYIDAEQVEAWRTRECVGRFERYLRRLGVLDHDAVEAVREDARETMREAIAEAEAMPAADLSLVFDTAYANPPASLARDQAELRRILAAEAA
jgi:pyruvate dehydrogenase E1 component alpha subunit